MHQKPATRALTTNRKHLRLGRGRWAESPWAMTWPAWKDILWRTWHSLKGDRVSLVAAGVAFYLLLSIVPALAAGLSVYGLVFDTTDVAEQIQELRGVVPAGILIFLGEEMRRLTASSGVGWSLVLSIAVGLWGASRAHLAISEALDVAYGEHSPRGMIASRLRALGLAMVTVLAGLISLGLLVVGPTVTAMLGWSDSALLGLARWPFAALTFWVWLTLTYRYAPTRRPAKWRWLPPGAVVAALLWLLVSAILTWYASEVVDLGKTYGSLAGVALLLLWLYWFGFSLLLGAELDAEIEHQTVIDTTVGEEKPRGERGAYVADTVGRAKTPERPWFSPPDAPPPSSSE